MIVIKFSCRIFISHLKLHLPHGQLILLQMLPNSSSRWIYRAWACSPVQESVQKKKKKKKKKKMLRTISGGFAGARSALFSKIVFFKTILMKLIVLYLLCNSYSKFCHIESWQSLAHLSIMHKKADMWFLWFCQWMQLIVNNFSSSLHSEKY